MSMASQFFGGSSSISDYTQSAVIQTSGTVAIPPMTKRIEALLCGGGGGGGSGFGGGFGGLQIFEIPVIGSSMNLLVGAGGAPGNRGGTTIVSINGTRYAAVGGGGAGGSRSGGLFGGSAGGIGNNSLVGVPGAAPFNRLPIWSALDGVGGFGGGSVFSEVQIGSAYCPFMTLGGPGGPPIAIRSGSTSAPTLLLAQAGPVYGGYGGAGGIIYYTSDYVNMPPAPGGGASLGAGGIGGGGSARVAVAGAGFAGGSMSAVTIWGFTGFAGGSGTSDPNNAGGGGGGMLAVGGNASGNTGGNGGNGGGGGGGGSTNGSGGNGFAVFRFFY